MLKMRTLAASAFAAASLTLGVFSASPASATTTANDCTTWNDSNTFGAYCSQTTSSTYYQAWAQCNNGQTVYGVWRQAGDGVWSYAYCSSVGSSLHHGGIRFL
ncbi:hypothetical protein [Kitasatospora sp. NPDC056184]|uniref:hypothetical protein n=1 Tax=Kitasatospora sp. NPDC056184 TaxID=3345738 RepID=UPI0035DE79E7